MKTLSQATLPFFDGLPVDERNGIDGNEKNCLVKALDKFLRTGDKADAFVVYFCFSEIFHLFGGGYENTQKLLEVLSDHEYHAGGLLTKHRDHYSHSVYVFALGLAMYAGDGKFRTVFCDFYGLKEGAERSFLYLWGMTALFHDIGYPFQLAHEQVKTYVNELWTDKSVRPFVSFGNMNGLTAIDERDEKDLQARLGIDEPIPDLDALFAYGLQLREGYDMRQAKKLLRTRIVEQPNFLDHGYFSAVLLARSLMDTDNFVMMTEKLDVLTAILLHNSFNRYDAKAFENWHKITPEEHPLAYLLMLCDELQNWDRTAFGKTSKKDPLGWTVELDVFDDRVDIAYYFDSFKVQVPQDEDRPNATVQALESGDFVRNIEGLINSTLALTACAKERKKTKKKGLYASQGNFVNLCDFAKAIHASYLENCQKLEIEYVNEEFGALSLEYKISNIEQAKSYAEKLELINCFYSDKELDYSVVEDFREMDTYGKKGGDNLGFLCREEHVRWVKEKLAMGWHYGTSYLAEKDKKKQTKLRNERKEHKDIVPYELLTEDERKKDEIMINNIIPLLYKHGGNIRIYRYREGRKPDLEIAGVGHRHISGDLEQIKAKVKEILKGYKKDYRVIVRTGFATGADQLIAECATELGISTKAVLPFPHDKYIAEVRKDAIVNGWSFTEEDELKMRHLLAQTVVCKTVTDEKEPYLAASEYILSKCQKLIAIWDGVETPLENDRGEPINRGGTYHCIRMALDNGKTKEDIHVISCKR